GEKDYHKAFSLIEEYCKVKEIPLRFYFVSEKEREIILRYYPDAETEKIEGLTDYVYSYSDLFSFSGKKYHGQKNFVNRFKKKYPDYKTEKIDGNNIGKVKDFFNFIYRKYPKDSSTYLTEEQSVYEICDNFSSYGQEGVIISVGGEIVAAAIGEGKGEVLFEHVEKANHDYEGASQILLNEFVKYFDERGIKYVNREDDAGDEGLRMSKLAYHPLFLAEKYIINVK
ncbi:MAG: phosphatidylglycerol lysyltransferase domain-containing protein, partial [Clostridia bacterium]|nr:phosphatidylglycerol lysyltransferase domain-containing protein [Clostridia bacterium]